MLQLILPLILLIACALAAPLQSQSQPQPQPQLQSQPQSPSLSSSHRVSDLYYTPISPVTDETRYTTRNPDAQLVAMNKVKHAKGNIVFSVGERINGDRMLENNYDDEAFTTAEDIEVEMRYPSSSGVAITLTSIEIYVDTSATDADAYLTDGGVGKSKASILLASNQTRQFSYEVFFYGY